MRQIVDVEALVKQGTKIPKGQQYRIRIDRTQYLWDKELITGSEILQLAGKTPPERFQVNQRLRGGQVMIIELDQQVDLTESGVERFVTLPLDQTEGRPLRYEFTLPLEDKEFLDSLELPWEAIKEPDCLWLIIRDVPLPTGYTTEQVNVALMIPPGYPTAQIDMAYFYPSLSRLDGKPITAISNQSIEGKSYQRWSRHRTAENPWRPEIDGVATHFALVKTWLEKERKK